MNKIGKKGQNLTGPMWGMIGAVAAFIILVFFLTIGSDITDRQQRSIQNQISGFVVNDTGTWSLAYNITMQGKTGLNQFAVQTPTIANVLVGVTILLLLFGAFAVFAYMRGNK